MATKKKNARPSNNPAGRPRSDEATQKLHEAVWDILREQGYEALSVEAVADRARVSRPAIYRRYGGRLALVLRALGEAGDSEVAMRQTASFRKDLERYLLDLAKALHEGSPVGRAFRGALSEALVNREARREFEALIRIQRRPVQQRLRADHPGLEHALADLLFGPVLYRLLIRGLPVSRAFVRRVVEAALSAASSPNSTPEP